MSLIGCWNDNAAPVSDVARPGTLPESASGGALIRINGVAVGRAIASGGGNGAAESIIAIDDIAGVIDGPARSGRRHLLLQGSRLFATRTGGCPKCPLRVRRAVLLSARVTRRGGRSYVPLADLVLALEGRIEEANGARDIRIRVGSCSGGAFSSLDPGEMRAGARQLRRARERGPDERHHRPACREDRVVQDREHPGGEAAAKYPGPRGHLHHPGCSECANEVRWQLMKTWVHPRDRGPG